MGKKQQKKSTKEAPAKGKKTKVKADPPSKKEKKQTKKSILDEIEAMSSSDEGSVDQSNAVWNKEAEELKKRIAEGAFESILASKGDKDDEESFEEAVLDDNEEEASDDEEEASADEGSENSEANSESDKDEDGEDGEQEQSKPTKKSKDILVKESSEEEESGGENEEEKEEKEEKEDSEQEDEEDEDEDEDNQQPLFDTNSKALLAKTEEILAERKCFPWIEKFDVIPSTPLPFGAVDEQTGTKIDVHDDLKREVAF